MPKYPFRSAAITVDFFDDVPPARIERYLRPIKVMLEELGRVEIARTPAAYAEPLPEDPKEK